jgi:hypothetical protein
MSLATVGCILAQAWQVVEPQTTAQDAFKHLPPMPSQARPTQTPIKTPLAQPKPLVAQARAFPSRQCAIPLLNVTPDNKAHYTIQTIAPPKEPAGAMIYVHAAPVCDGSGQSSNSAFVKDVPIKK